MPERWKPEPTREQKDLEIKKIANSGLEMHDGRRLPIIFFPRRLRKAIERIAESPMGLYGLLNPTPYNEKFWREDLQKGRLWGISENEIKEIAELLSPLVAEREERRAQFPERKMEVYANRTVVFRSESELIQGIETAPDNGGASSNPTGSCLDSDGTGWMKKILVEYASGRENSAITFLYDLDDLEFIPKDLRMLDENLRVKYFGYRPIQGKTFPDALLGLMVFG